MSNIKILKQKIEVLENIIKEDHELIYTENLDGSFQYVKGVSLRKEFNPLSMGREYSKAFLLALLSNYLDWDIAMIQAHGGQPIDQDRKDYNNIKQMFERALKKAPENFKQDYDRNRWGMYYFAKFDIIPNKAYEEVTHGTDKTTVL